MVTTSKTGRASGLVRPFLIGLTTTLVLVAVVLASAGRVTVWQAWVYAGISVVANLGQRIVLRGHPELARERSNAGSKAASWDKALLALLFLLTLATLVTAGLQFRHSASPSLAFVWFVVGLVLNLAGAALFLWALKENRFFSAVVRIQSDRGHAVCTTGPYRIVRHPGNLGMIFGTVGVPLVFQSTWSLVPATLAAVALIVRTHLEDALLTKDLDGYRDYRQQTKSRLIPGLW